MCQPCPHLTGVTVPPYKGDPAPAMPSHYGCDHIAAMPSCMGDCVPAVPSPYTGDRMATMPSSRGDRVPAAPPQRGPWSLPRRPGAGRGRAGAAPQRPQARAGRLPGGPHPAAAGTGRRQRRRRARQGVLRASPRAYLTTLRRSPAASPRSRRSQRHVLPGRGLGRLLPLHPGCAAAGDARRLEGPRRLPRWASPEPPAPSPRAEQSRLLPPSALPPRPALALPAPAPGSRAAAGGTRLPGPRRSQQRLSALFGTRTPLETWMGSCYPLPHPLNQGISTCFCTRTHL